MTKFQLTEFLTWMTNHQPSSKQVLDEMYVYDVALVMQTVRDEFARLQAERDAALAVVNEFIIDTTTNNETPDHECEFSHSPETGKCNACEAWGKYVGLFCSREDEEAEEETL